MPRIVGYLCDGDSWCTDCAASEPRFQWRHYDLDLWLDERGISVIARGRLGETVHPVFSTDGVGPQFRFSCGQCDVYIVEPSVMCSCGDGCREDDCPACDDEDEVEDEVDEGPAYSGDEARGCTCVDCTSAAAWTQDVS